MEKHYWEISGPRQYLNIPCPVPGYWRAALTLWDKNITVVGWGDTESEARAAARKLAAAH